MENNNNHSDTVGFDTERVDEMMVRIFRINYNINIIIIIH